MTEEDPAPALTQDTRDARVLRRALRAGGWVFGVLSVVTVAANVGFGGGGAAALIWVTASFAMGSIVAAGWLILALLADMAAGETPSRRRSLWTAAVFAVAFVSPILPAAALLAAANSS